MPARAGTSVAIVLQHLLRAWVDLDLADEIHLVRGSQGAAIDLPDEVVVHEVAGRLAPLDRQRAQNLLVPRLCNQLDAHAMLASLPSTTVAPLPCPTVAIVYDLRHELLPEQFSWKARLLRKVSYDLAYRKADALTCISNRTRDDLLRSRPWLRDRRVDVALLGGDHVDAWRPTEAGRWATAFGHYGNKRVDTVIEAWRLLRDRGVDVPPVRILGLGGEARTEAEAHIARLDLGGLVVPTPWLPDDEHRATIAGSGLVVFPSEFEGFGLPAVEAMRLGVPLVVSDDPALLEVTGGHAEVMAERTPTGLADAVVAALARSPRQLDAARHHAAGFTWEATARSVRATVEAVTDPRRSTRELVPAGS